MENEPSETGESQNGLSFISHLAELRARLLHSVYCVLLVFLALFYFASDLYHLIATPLLNQFGPGQGMIATQVAAPFLVPIKLTFFLSVFLSIPYILYQAWAFIMPGLYENERRLVLPLIITSSVLFYIGIAFAFFVVFPLVFGFFAGIAPEGVSVMTDIGHYLDFILKMFFAFGLAFEVPIATFIIIWSGFTTVDTLQKNRPYIIVSAFVIGMLLTPPDVISQLMLALPIWGLFELGLFISHKYISQSVNENQTSYNGKT